MKRWIRKQLLKVPGIRGFDQYLARLPVLRHIRFRTRWLLATEAERIDLRIHSWVMGNVEFVSRYDLVDFSFSKEDVFVRAADGLEYSYDLRHPAGMLYSICLGESMDQLEIDLILKNLRPGSIIFDVGAGIGEYSLNIVSRIEGATAYAFEPTVETWQLLRKNIARNKLEQRIHCYQLALADSSGQIPLTSINNGTRIIKHANPAREHKTAHRMVAVTTVDSFVCRSTIPRVDFIKADIEGAELFMLKGAINCLNLHKPLLQLEIDKSWTERMGYSPLEVFEYLRHLGYRHVYVSKKNKVVCRPTQTSDIAEQLERGYNFVFYHEDKPIICE